MLGEKSDMEHRSVLSNAVKTWRKHITQANKGNYILELIMKALLQNNGKREGVFSF